jgi:septum formation protein
VLYLASTSPRRRALLDASGIDYCEVAPGHEVEGEGSPRRRAVQRAASKAEGARVDGAPGQVLGVDTVVELDDVELGKPKDRADAERMLRMLAGRSHLVHTALCLRTHPRGAARHALATSLVFCRRLAEPELAAYLDGGEWEGKAGAYGIQGHAAAFIELREGELDTVIGLPINVLRRLLGAGGGA